MEEFINMAVRCCTEVLVDECCPCVSRPAAGGITIFVGLLITALGAVLCWYSFSNPLINQTPLHYLVIGPVLLGVMIMFTGGSICCNKEC